MFEDQKVDLRNVTTREKFRDKPDQGSRDTVWIFYGFHDTVWIFFDF